MRRLRFRGDGNCRRVVRQGSASLSWSFRPLRPNLARSERDNGCTWPKVVDSTAHAGIWSDDRPYNKEATADWLILYRTITSGASSRPSGKERHPIPFSVQICEFQRSTTLSVGLRVSLGSVTRCTSSAVIPRASSGFSWPRLFRLEALAGWILTAIALSLGAPFWFDLLNKFMVIRSTIKPQERSRIEKSKA
jgi:hypothetical protein